jgi:hypothetical protein
MMKKLDCTSREANKSILLVESCQDLYFSPIQYIPIIIPILPIALGPFLSVLPLLALCLHFDSFRPHELALSQ